MQHATYSNIKAPINHVIGISWPRSGHHLLERLLKRYIGERFVYCTDYFGEKMNETEYKARCCDTQLCPYRDHVHFCKNHDERLLVPKVSGARYLVQYRSFVPAMISNFEKRAGIHCEDTEEDFRQIALRRARKYRNFIEKWVLPRDTGIQKLVIRYEDLTGDTQNSMMKILDLFGLGASIDHHYLRDIIATEAKHANLKGERIVTENFGVRLTRNPENFRYYSSDFFARLEEMTHFNV